MKMFPFKMELRIGTSLLGMPAWMAALALGACVPKQPTRADAEQLVKGLEAITEAGEDSTPSGASIHSAIRTNLIYGLCGEIPTCAGECSHNELSSMSGFDSNQRGAVLAQCSDGFKRERKAGGPPADAWMWKYMGGYATRARAELGPQDQNRLDQVRAKLDL